MSGILILPLSFSECFGKISVAPIIANDLGRQIEAQLQIDPNPDNHEVRNEIDKVGTGSAKISGGDRMP